jgi:hypothetical protein
VSSAGPSWVSRLSLASLAESRHFSNKVFLSGLADYFRLMPHNGFKLQMGPPIDLLQDRACLQLCFRRESAHMRGKLQQAGEKPDLNPLNGRSYEINPMFSMG